MAIAIMSNPLFDEMPKRTSSDSVEDIQADAVESTELENAMPKVENIEGATATPAAEPVIDGWLSSNGRKIHHKSPKLSQQELNCPTRGGAVTRLSIRNQPSASKTPTTFTSNDFHDSVDEDHTRIRITRNTKKKDEENIPPGVVAASIALGPSSKIAMPKLSQASPHSGSGNQSISSDGGVKQKSSRVTTPSGQSKAVAGVKSSEKAHWPSTSGEKGQIGSTSQTKKIENSVKEEMPVQPQDASGKKKASSSGRGSSTKKSASERTEKTGMTKVGPSPSSSRGVASLSSDDGVKLKSPSGTQPPSGQPRAVAGVKSSEKAHQQVFDEQRQSNPRGKTLKLTAPAVDALTQSSTGEGRQSSTSRHFCF
jgi:hypothetical protein